MPKSIPRSGMVTRRRATKAENDNSPRARQPTRSIPRYAYSSLSDPSTEIRTEDLMEKEQRVHGIFGGKEDFPLYAIWLLHVAGYIFYLAVICFFTLLKYTKRQLLPI